MVEISFWRPGGEKTRGIYTLDSLDSVELQIEGVSNGDKKYASFSHPTEEGKIYVPEFVFRECVVIVAFVGDNPSRSVVL